MIVHFDVCGCCLAYSSRLRSGAVAVSSHRWNVAVVRTPLGAGNRSVQHGCNSLMVRPDKKARIPAVRSRGPSWRCRSPMDREVRIRRRSLFSRDIRRGEISSGGVQPQQDGDQCGPNLPQHVMANLLNKGRNDLERPETYHAPVAACLHPSDWHETGPSRLGSGTLHSQRLREFIRRIFFNHYHG